MSRWLCEIFQGWAVIIQGRLPMAEKIEYALHARRLEGVQYGAGNTVNACLFLQGLFRGRVKVLQEFAETHDMHQLMHGHIEHQREQGNIERWV